MTSPRPSGARRPVTMQDIAQAAGVSQSTVSRVLNGVSTSVPIADNTRQRVIEVADRLGYRPNPLARGLRGARTMLVGVIVRDITDPFFSVAVDSLSSEALARGYNLVLGSAHGKADEAIALHAVLETRHCDAIVLLGDMRDQPRFLEDLRASHTPLVSMWNGSELEGIPTVNTDNQSGITQALDHLCDLGHEQIAFVGTRPLGDIRERKAAFLAGIEKRGMEVPHDYVQDATNHPSGGDTAFRRLWSLRTPPTAVICATDHLATGVLHAAAKTGVTVPTNLSVVGFDDIPAASFTVPALTSVHMPVAEMTAIAAKLAMDPRSEEPEQVPTVVVAPTLVVRESTAPPEPA